MNFSKLFILITIAIGFLFLNPNSTGAETIFTRNLHVGSYGEDVATLQRKLNQNPATLLASTGAGSPGQETKYFGPLTKNAVIRFQEFYKNEILTPVGLSLGTGYVGPSTRKKLNKNNNPNLNISSPDVFSIVRIEPASSAPGWAVALYGRGFTGEETITVGGKQAAISSRSNRSLILFYIPNLSPGRHMVVLKRGAQISNDITFLVTSPTVVSPPEINILSPTTGRQGTEVTITGSGFHPTDNTVYLSYATISNIASKDGKTIKVKIIPNLLPLIDNEDGAVTFPFWIYIENPSGVSNYKIFNYIP